MSITRRIALAAAVALAACSKGSSDGPTPPTVSAFDGTWVVCRNDGELDYREVFTVAGESLTGHDIAYQTSDATCDGDGAPGPAIAVTVAYGTTTPATLGSETVEATEVNLTFPGPEVVYEIFYRDSAARPESLYLGDDSGPLDGTTPARRPDTLQDLGRALQTSPVEADLAGTWSSCTAAGGGTIDIDTVARTLRARKWDGPCTGEPSEDLSFTYTLDAPVYALHGGATVTAFALDMHRATATGYQTFWIDVAAIPRALYHGDDGLHGMDGSTPSLRPRVLSADASFEQ